MTNVERTGERDLAFSNWHRTAFPDDCSAFDVDLIGKCATCRADLYAIESTRSKGTKYTNWLEGVASRLNVPAYLIRYTTDQPPPCDLCEQHPPSTLLKLTAQQVWPGRGPVIAEDAFVRLLNGIRDAHDCHRHWFQRRTRLATRTSPTPVHKPLATWG
jgi:hypothetical protein